MQKSKFITSSQSTGYQVILKRCLIGLQKGVSNTLKEHLLHSKITSKIQLIENKEVTLLA